MLTMYGSAIPPLKRGLRVILRYLDTAERQLDRIGISEDELVATRLASDMLTFAGQVQRASDNAKNGVARITGVAAPAMADSERNLDELRHRVLATIDYLDSFGPDAFAGSETRTVSLSFKSVSGDITGDDYLTMILLPNFYFHIATIHGILRHVGADIGKQDYLHP